jgi:hypothetical protein
MNEPVIAISNDQNTPGVLGTGPTGVLGRNTVGIGSGVLGYSAEGRGVWGRSNKTGIGVLGEGVKAVGAYGTSTENGGVRGVQSCRVVVGFLPGSSAGRVN